MRWPLDPHDLQVPAAAPRSPSPSANKTRATLVGPVNDTAACAKNCRLEGANAEYNATYGVSTSGDELKLQFVTTQSTSFNVGSRVFLMENDTSYKMFQLLSAQRRRPNRGGRSGLVGAAVVLLPGDEDGRITRRTGE